MAELSSVHRYAAGGLLALALSQAQIQQHSAFGLAPIVDPEDTGSKSFFFDEDRVPWSSEECGLLRHIFRYLRIEEKAWVGLEITSVSPDAKHHIGAFLRMLSEEENGSSSSNESELALEKVVDAAASCYEVAGRGRSRSTLGRLFGKDKGKGKVHERGSSSFNGGDTGFSEAKVMTKQLKIAVMHELLTACVADIPDSSGRIPRLGYDSRQRVALRLLALWLDIKWSKVAGMELMVAHMAFAAQRENEERPHDEEEVAKSRWRKLKRGGLIGAAAVTGGALLAVTGGLAAPALAAGMAALGVAVPALGAGGLATAAALAGTTMGSVAVAASFGAAGAGLTGFKMARRTGGIEEFQFEPIGENHQQGRLAVAIVASGIAFKPHDYVRPWEGPDGDLERYALRWESNHVLAVSTAIQDWLTSRPSLTRRILRFEWSRLRGVIPFTLTGTNLIAPDLNGQDYAALFLSRLQGVAKEMMKRGALATVLGGVVAALAWPAALLSATDFIDSKWSVAIDRSDKVGKVLAKVLLKGGQGNRPVTLMGFSLGARVVFACLEELAKKGNTGGIVERVVLLGAPLVLNKARWESARKVVAGRFINGYSTNDWMLGVVYRATFLTQGLAGLQPVNLPGIENVDVTDVVKGHSSYLSKVGYIVEALEIDSFYPTHNYKIQLQRS